MILILKYFFFISIIEDLIVIPLPEKKKDLIEFLPCNYFINKSSYKISILKKRKKIKLNKILVNFRKKKRSGLIIFSSGSTGFPKIILHDFNLILNNFKKERPGYKSLLMLSFDHLGINTLLASLVNKIAWQFVYLKGQKSLPNNK